MPARPALILFLLAAQVISAQQWSIETVGRGTKPSLALTPEGEPRIAFMTEEAVGGLFYSRRGEGGWDNETVAQGYFYGPLDLKIDDTGASHIVWHDHQETMFAPSVGDPVYATDGSGDWSVETIFHPGHDGWDGSVAVAPDGQVHIASIDPAQFGSADGVEWGLRTDSGWQIRQVGSGPIPYEFATGLAVDSQGRAHLSWHNGSERFAPDADGADLLYAVGGESGFRIEVVDAEGDVGKFSSLVLDANEQPHLASFERTERRAGYARYHERDDNGNWHSERVAPMADVTIAFLGARKNVSLALDARSEPHLAFCDRAGLYYARRGDDGWDVEVVATPTAGNVLGQMASLALDANGRAHMAFYEIDAQAVNSTGDILYASGPMPPTAVSTDLASVPLQSSLSPGFPNPFNAQVVLPYTIGEAGHTRLAMFDMTGRLVRTLVSGHRDAGSHRVTWDGRDEAGRRVASGVYLARLHADSDATIKLMLVQ
jgi:hypothetical protein